MGNGTRAEFAGFGRSATYQELKDDPNFVLGYISALEDMMRALFPAIHAVDTNQLGIIKMLLADVNHDVDEFIERLQSPGVG